MTAQAPYPPELKRLRALARIMDRWARIPGTDITIGLDSLLGLVPGLGDGASAMVALYAVYLARQCGAPKKVILQMFGNVAIDFMIGAIPVAGDVADVFFRAHLRNLALLEDHLRARDNDR